MKQRLGLNGHEPGGNNKGAEEISRDNNDNDGDGGDVEESETGDGLVGP
ncbi:hypothetical protein J7L02_01720 [Candidatus Woesearchaeota archaeon]|nr:hypothetical protein [Candidatus Woesearchaeota archaeon]